MNRIPVRTIWRLGIRHRPQNRRSRFPAALRAACQAHRSRWDLTYRTARRSAEETAAQVEDLLSQLRRERDRTAERAAELERERERLLAGM